MQSVEKLKVISHRVRMLVFTVLAMTIGVLVYGYLTQGEWWITFGDQQLNQLWHEHAQWRLSLLLLISPLLISLIAGFYWLQRFLLELSRGLFFSVTSMLCIKWLAWLALFSTFYSMIWPLFASLLIDYNLPIHINIRPLTLMAVLCLPVIVHLLSAARELDQENKEIV